MTDATTPEQPLAGERFGRALGRIMQKHRGVDARLVNSILREAWAEAQARPAVASDRCVCGHLNATCTVPEGAHRG